MRYTIINKNERSANRNKRKNDTNDCDDKKKTVMTAIIKTSHDCDDKNDTNYCNKKNTPLLTSILRTTPLTAIKKQH